MANERTDPPNDDATERQREMGTRRGERIPGKGFDPGGGYGGAGNDSLYDAGSSYGGQSGIGGSTTRGAYAGESYGRNGDRNGDRDVASPNGGESALSASEDDFDGDSPLGGERREPGR